MIHTEDTCSAIMLFALQIKYDLAYTLLNCMYFRVRGIAVLKKDKHLELYSSKFAI